MDAHAATFEVTNRADLVDALPGDGVCATGAGLCTLRAAIAEANALSGPDTVTLVEGTYSLTLGELPITDAVTILGASAKSTTVSGKRRARVISVIAPAVVQLSGFTIEDGLADDLGGGIRNTGTLTLTDMDVMHNTAEEGRGGGLYNEGELTLSQVNISFNEANAGGGLYNAAGAAELTNVTLADNRAHEGGGAGILNAATVVLVGATFDYNRARLGVGGGGLYNLGSAELTNVTFSRNRARRSFGGAISNVGSVKLTNVSMIDNQARFESAGLVNHGTAILQNTILSGNDSVNRAPSTRGGNCGGDPVISLGHNIESGTFCGLTGPGDLSDTDPLVDNLAANGGFTKTYALNPQSPAIDSGDDSACQATDQRGAARPEDGNRDGSALCDIGAFEAPLPPPPTPTRTPRRPRPTKPPTAPPATPTPPHTATLTATETPTEEPAPTDTVPVPPTETPTP